MSDDYMRFVPKDPLFVPAPAARKKAAAFLRRVVPRARDINVTVADDVQFIDCGGNWEGVRCPHCKATLEDWWTDALDQAKATELAARAYKLPCCGRSSTLPDLDFAWPVAFGRFVLEAQNAGIGGKLPKKHWSELERILGCPLRLVLAHY